MVKTLKNNNKSKSPYLAIINQSVDDVRDKWIPLFKRTKFKRKLGVGGNKCLVPKQVDGKLSINAKIPACHIAAYLKFGRKKLEKVPSHKVCCYLLYANL